MGLPILKEGSYVQVSCSSLGRFYGGNDRDVLVGLRSAQLLEFVGHDPHVPSGFVCRNTTQTGKAHLINPNDGGQLVYPPIHDAGGRF